MIALATVILTSISSFAGTVMPDHESACDPLLLEISADPHDYAKALEVLEFMTFTAGPGLELLARADSDVAYEHVLFLATGYSLPAPKRAWWGLDAPIGGMHSAMFKRFEVNHARMHRALRKTQQALEREVYVGRLVRNVRRLEEWLTQRAQDASSSDSVAFFLGEGKNGRAVFRPNATYVREGPYPNAARRTLLPLREDVVSDLVSRFVSANFGLVTENHFELGRKFDRMGDEKTYVPRDVSLGTRPTGRALHRALEDFRAMAGPVLAERALLPEAILQPESAAEPRPEFEELPARVKSSDDLARLLKEPIPRSWRDREIGTREALAFVTSIQSQVTRLALRVPDWSLLAGAVGQTPGWVPFLERHLGGHRGAAFARSELLLQARRDLEDLVDWVVRAREAWAERGVDEVEELEPSEARSMGLALRLLPRVNDLVLAARGGLDLRIAREDDLRETVQNVELLLSKTLQSFITGFPFETATAELSEALAALAANP